jgi:hypothetical protein
VNPVAAQGSEGCPGFHELDAREEKYELSSAKAIKNANNCAPLAIQTWSDC